MCVEMMLKLLLYFLISQDIVFNLLQLFFLFRHKGKSERVIGRLKAKHVTVHSRQRVASIVAHRAWLLINIHKTGKTHIAVIGVRLVGITLCCTQRTRRFYRVLWRLGTTDWQLVETQRVHGLRKNVCVSCLQILISELVQVHTVIHAFLVVQRLEGEQISNYSIFDFLLLCFLCTSKAAARPQEELLQS